MATNYPTTLQDLDATRGSATDRLNSPSHVTHHALEDDTLEAIQTKLGVDSSAVVTSIDYLLKNTASSNPGHKHTLADGATDITASVAELNYVDGVTSAIQTQINAKAPTASPSFTGDLGLATGGNIQVNSLDPKRAFYIPASAMTPATTNGAASGTYESSTNKVIIPVYDFDTTTQEFVAVAIPSPHFWDALTVTVQFIWTAASGSAGDTVVWAAQGIAFSDDDPLDTAYGTEQTASDVVIATLDDHHSPFTSAITIAGTPVAGDLICLRFKRVPGSDNLASDARLIGVKVRFGIAQYDDQ